MKFSSNQRVQIRSKRLLAEFPKLLPSNCDRGTIEMLKNVAGVEIALVNFDNVGIIKLPSAFLSPIFADPPR